MHGEGVDKSDFCMRVIRNSRDRGWNNGAEFDRDIKTDGRPVRITGVNSFLVLAHGVDLNVGLTFANEGRALPSYNIFDVIVGESTENDDVTTEKWLVAPTNGVDVDAIVYASVHALWVNCPDNCVINLSSSTIPAGSKVFCGKGTRDYFVSVKVVDRG